MDNESTMPDKVYVNSQNLKTALQLFINRHRTSLQQLAEQNHKLQQTNTQLTAQLCNQEVTLKALNEKNAAVEKEITKLKEEQARLMEYKSSVRSNLLQYKKRFDELMINSEKQNLEMQQTIDKQQRELEARNDTEKELEKKLDVIRKELQTKSDECDKSNEAFAQLQTEMNERKQQIEELEKSLASLRDELREKDETIDKVRKEYVAYKTETDKNISKMQEVQRIIYPNASNPLPRKTSQNAEIRSTAPPNVSVQPNRQRKSTLKRIASTSSSQSDSENESLLIRGWVPPTNLNDLLPGVDERVGFESRSSDIPQTPESCVQNKRKRYRH